MSNIFLFDLNKWKLSYKFREFFIAIDWLDFYILNMLEYIYK